MAMLGLAGNGVMPPEPTTEDDERRITGRVLFSVFTIHSLMSYFCLCDVGCVPPPKNGCWENGVLPWAW